MPYTRLLWVLMDDKCPSGKGGREPSIGMGSLLSLLGRLCSLGLLGSPNLIHEQYEPTITDNVRNDQPFSRGFFFHAVACEKAFQP